ncbi:MAG: murein biosynthesis integral membrane protein MurJ [Holophagales bacterium]|nr:MAG: murein biosynthesis integral membrane protein MurJ [Holophagales bacterium]
MPLETNSTPRATPAPAATRSSGGATLVATGILASRVAGLIRDRALAHYFGLGPHQDVFRSALKGPNLVQNLLGEQALSASFIPIYSRLLKEGKREEAGRFAGAIFGLLLAVVAAISLVGFLFARPIVALFATGFLLDAAKVARGELAVDRFPLAVAAVRWMFPMTGLLVLSAWALGVLNSHRRFLLSYLAPVVWNASIIAAVVWVGQGIAAGEGRSGLDRLLISACCGALLGGALQFLVQVPGVVHEVRGFHLSFGWRDSRVRAALSGFGPAVGGRGVLQLSSWLDQQLASMFAPGALAALGYSQQLYLLPISLFAMSLAAASLPELSEGTASGGTEWADRLLRNVRQVSFFVIPSMVGYLVFGRLIVAGLFRTGSFGDPEVLLVGAILGAYSLGLPAAGAARPLQSGFYAHGDTRRPALIAAARVVASTAIAIPAMVWLDRYSVGGGATAPLHLGAVGLAAGSAIGSWIEFFSLWRRLRGLHPTLRLPWREVARNLGLAIVAAGGAWVLGWAVPSGMPRAVVAGSVLAAFGIAYLGGAMALGLPEVEPIRRRLHLRRG